jgi:hypothetical protein
MGPPTQHLQNEDKTDTNISSVYYVQALHMFRPFLGHYQANHNIVTWLVTETGFGLVIGFINHSQVVTTINYNIVPDLHNLQSLHYNLLGLFPLVFTIYFLATDLNIGIITDSQHFIYHCTKSLLITINTELPLFLHFMVQLHTLVLS